MHLTKAGFRAPYGSPIAALLLACMLAACAEGGSRSPSASVEYPWQEIVPTQSAMVITGPEDHRHRAHKIGSRYQELVSFTNGASVTFEMLEGIHAAFGVTGSDIIKGWYGTDAAKDGGFAHKNNAVRRSGEAFALTDTGSNRTCSFYGRVFGGTGYGGNGDQLYRITYCTASGPNAAASTERIVNDLAVRLEGTPQIARMSPTLLRTPVSAVIPASR
jgi:hypothetical protein